MFPRSSLLIVPVFFLVHNVQAAGKVSCFYNASDTYKNGAIRVTYEQLTDAAPYCTHLVYGFLVIDEQKYEVNLSSPVDVEYKLKNLQYTAKLKNNNPSIKLLLSVGGFVDPKQHPYFKVLETNDSRATFIKSLVSKVEENLFDGADLAWPFPIQEENKTEPINDTSVGFVKEHRTLFRHLVEELSTELTGRKRLLTLTVLPHVKADEFIDFDTIKDCVEHIHLMTYDYKTPWRFPNEADYTAPLYYVKNRNENRNVEQTVNWWIKQNVPAEKLLIAIPTFGRTWRIDKKSGEEMKPPLKANGTSTARLKYLIESDPGTVAYYELCNHLTSSEYGDNPEMLRKVTDTEHHFGSYAYRQGNGENESMWVSFEEPSTAAEKAKFANRVNLGGVAIVDLVFDDHPGWCQNFRGEKFPILRAAVSGRQ